MNILDVKKIEFKKFTDQRGSLSVIEDCSDIPFAIKRAYWLYDVPEGEERYGHAFKEQHELIVALSGSFDVVLSDGGEEVRYHLNRSNYGIYIPNMIWRRIDNFSTNSVALILSSTEYDERDYIEEFNEYITYKKEYESEV